MVYDVVIVGAGVIGSTIARELMAYNCKVALVEKGPDVATGASKANSGIVHSGYDPIPGTKKAYYNVRGANMMEETCKQLHVLYKNCGSLIVAFSKEDMASLEELLERGKKNGVKGLEILSKEEVHKREPKLSDGVVGALWTPTAGIVCPYGLTIAAAECAANNGATIKTEFLVNRIEKKNGLWCVSDGKEELQCKLVINAAGTHSPDISKLVGDEKIDLQFRKGEYILFDKKFGKTVNTVIFQTPSERGKGILVTPTADGNLLIGPTSDEIDDPLDKSTDEKSLKEIIKIAKLSVEDLPLRNSITTFAGVRATPLTHDFIIGPSKKTDNYYVVAGIESPGLTSAPAIAVDVAKDVAQILKLNKNEKYDPTRKEHFDFSEASDKERADMIKKNPKYGRVICRCEIVTEGEIVDAIHAGARTIDAVKRRTRAGMGRCQGGFCSSRVAEILARELNIPITEVTKDGKGTQLFVEPSGKGIDK